MQNQYNRKRNHSGQECSSNPAMVVEGEIEYCEDTREEGNIDDISKRYRTMPRDEEEAFLAYLELKEEQPSSYEIKSSSDEITPNEVEVFECIKDLSPKVAAEVLGLYDEVAEKISKLPDHSSRSQATSLGGFFNPTPPRLRWNESKRFADNPKKESVEEKIEDSVFEANKILMLKINSKPIQETPIEYDLDSKLSLNSSQSRKISNLLKTAMSFCPKKTDDNSIHMAEVLKKQIEGLSYFQRLRILTKTMVYKRKKYSEMQKQRQQTKKKFVTMMILAMVLGMATNLVCDVSRRIFHR